MNAMFQPASTGHQFMIEYSQECVEMSRSFREYLQHKFDFYCYILCSSKMHDVRKMGEESSNNVVRWSSYPCV